MTVEYIGDGNTDGTCLGSSATELVAFHGATPSAQSTAVTNTTGSLGDTNVAVLAIITMLQAKGLMA